MKACNSPLLPHVKRVAEDDDKMQQKGRERTVPAAASFLEKWVSASPSRVRSFNFHRRAVPRRFEECK